jgi:hypothetical protein
MTVRIVLAVATLLHGAAHLLGIARRAERH